MYEKNTMASLRDAYNLTLLSLGELDKRVVVLEADTSALSKSTLFASRFPDRFVNVGVAEQDMIGTAAGLAAEGMIPFVSGMAVFITLRSLEQIRTSVAYANLNVKIVASYAGLSAGPNGPTHFAIEDLAVINAIPGMVILAPADANAISLALIEAYKYYGPVYIRSSRVEVPVVWEKSSRLQIGTAIEWKTGKDLTLMVTGTLLHLTLEAACRLESNGISTGVLEFHTLKPIDVNAIIKSSKETGAIVTIEEHNIYGGLGSIVSQIVTANYPCWVKNIGIRDNFVETGDYKDLLSICGITVEDIVNTSISLLCARRCKHEP